jgi:hypothetical protein
VRERIVVDREYVQGRIAELRFFEKVAERLGFDEDAARCAHWRAQWEELLECLDEMEKARRETAE